MASLKALKIRINSVKSTQKITKAMKMVAAAKLRRAQEAAQAGRPYAERLEAVVASLSRQLAGGAGVSPLLSGTGKDQVHLLVVATSERGLAGAFNSNIVRAARRKAEELIAQGKSNLHAPWLGISAFVSLSAMLTLLVFTGEAVRDAFDPRKN